MSLVFLVHFQEDHVFSCLSLFFLFTLINLVSKSVYVTKLAFSNFAAKVSPVNLLNSEVIMHLS